MIYPTQQELMNCVLFGGKHSAHVEGYLHSCGFKVIDLERPHDLVGTGNKFAPEVLPGLALEARLYDALENIVAKLTTKNREKYAYLHSFKGKDLLRTVLLIEEEQITAVAGVVELCRQVRVINDIIKHTVSIHREQYHHRMWNGEQPHPDACDQDMILGAVDTICTYLEPRKYNGGARTFQEIRKLNEIKINAGFKQFWIKQVLLEMEKIGQLNLDSLADVDDLPSQLDFLPEYRYDQIKAKIGETVARVKENYR
ncbi:hypothetical protein HZC32_03585 [Candidatus Woesearchaeota archaeon]|nr:hypothetical protein [Candidatus Woesearchaeota archaeon]